MRPTVPAIRTGPACPNTNAAGRARVASRQPHRSSAARAAFVSVVPLWFIPRARTAAPPKDLR